MSRGLFPLSYLWLLPVPLLNEKLLCTKLLHIFLQYQELSRHSDLKSILYLISRSKFLLSKQSYLLVPLLKQTFISIITLFDYFKQENSFYQFCNQKCFQIPSCATFSLHICTVFAGGNNKLLCSKNI
jgi:hypothetical protein